MHKMTTYIINAYTKVLFSFFCLLSCLRCPVVLTYYYFLKYRKRDLHKICIFETDTIDNEFPPKNNHYFFLLTYLDFPFEKFVLRFPIFFFSALRLAFLSFFNLLSTYFTTVRPPFPFLFGTMCPPLEEQTT